MSEAAQFEEPLFARLLCDVMIPVELSEALRAHGYDVAEARLLPLTRRAHATIPVGIVAWPHSAVAASAASLFDEDAAHGLCGGGEEVVAAVKLLVAGEAQIRFVDQGGGIERLARLFVSQLGRGDPAQLVVEQRQELLRGLRVALLNGFQ